MAESKKKTGKKKTGKKRRADPLSFNFGYNALPKSKRPKGGKFGS
jgi:hypothetical protein